MVSYRLNSNRINRYKMICTERRKLRKRRIIARRRRICAGLLVLSLAFVLFGTNVISTAFAKTNRDCFSVIVSAGDSVWSIAERYNSKNKDIRSVVNDIVRLNNIAGANIYAGDTINIPVY